MKMKDKPGRPRATAALIVLLLLPLLFFSSPKTAARGEEEELRREADLITSQLIDLKARVKEAENNREGLLREMQEIEAAVAAVTGEVETLERELVERQAAYEDSLRSLYMQDDLSELEVILGCGEIEETWENVEFHRRFVSSCLDSLRRLRATRERLALKERELRDKKARKERILETLETESLQARIAELESRLSDINKRMREMEMGGTTPSPPPPAPPSWSVPPPGKLLDRVPVSPPLSDFERTGIVFSGYTTSYGVGFHGRSTASGVIFNMYDYTCAHRTLPFGTWLLVTFRGRQVIVQVNDRGPFVPGRVLDLSYAAARDLGLDGIQWTEFEVLVPRGGG